MQLILPAAAHNRKVSEVTPNCDAARDPVTYGMRLSKNDHPFETFGIPAVYRSILFSLTSRTLKFYDEIILHLRFSSKLPV